MQDIGLKVFHPLVTYVCRRSLPRWCLSVCLAILLCGCRSATRDGSLALKPEAALDYIVEAFDRYPVVALSELHGNRESAAFLAMLIRHKGFSRRVNDIVVDSVTPPINPWSIATSQERRSAVTSFGGRGRTPLRSAGSGFRVLLGDPPVDWSKVPSPADDDMSDWRDAHFAWVLEHYVLPGIGGHCSSSAGAHQPQGALSE